MFFDALAESGDLWRDILRFRAPPGFRERIAEAAIREDLTMSEFLRQAAIERADRLLKNNVATQRRRRPHANT